jgi:RNA recognition motif-containing protein
VFSLCDAFAVSITYSLFLFFTISSGQSRRFGFIGYRSDKVADAALTHFNGTFINTSKIIVEKAIPVSRMET